MFFYFSLYEVQILQHTNCSFANNYPHLCTMILYYKKISFKECMNNGKLLDTVIVIRCNHANRNQN
jgi:hypothetical protein